MRRPLLTFEDVLKIPLSPILTPFGLVRGIMDYSSEENGKENLSRYPDESLIGYFVGTLFWNIGYGLIQPNRVIGHYLRKRQSITPR